MTRTIKLLAALCLFFICSRAGAVDDKQVNAMLVLPSGQTAFNGKFQDFLDKKGAKLLHSYPPSVFVGYIPAALDAELGEMYGALVYRDRVEDWSSFARYGESAVFAVNAWNKRFVEDPPEAPLVVSSMVQRSGRKGEALSLTWNEVIKAASYHLQISSDEAFSAFSLDTVLPRNNYRLFPAFWKDGVYYWRVAGILTLNNGAAKEGPFSEANSFAVSKPARSAGPKPAAQALPAKAGFPTEKITWYPGAARYYRLQISKTTDFDSPLADVFTDTCTYKAAELPVKAGKAYYMRVMGADTFGPGDWSNISEVTIEPRPARRKARK